MIKARIHRLNPELPLPQYLTNGSVGFDLYSATEAIIAPKEHAYLPTGLIIQPPEGFSLFIFSRSSLFKKTGLILANSVGVIDIDFCGPTDELKLSVWNTSELPVSIVAGQRLAQGVFLPYQPIEFEEFTPNNQNRGGLGSTQ